MKNKDKAIYHARDWKKTPGHCGHRARPDSSILSEDRWQALSERLRLSPREAQIVRAIFDDLTEPAIASALGISPHTVHTHMERLHRKLGAVDRAQVILTILNEYLQVLEYAGSLTPLGRRCLGNHP